MFLNINSTIFRSFRNRSLKLVAGCYSIFIFILLGWSVDEIISSNYTLQSREDLSSIDIVENKKTLTNKRELPKVQSVIINLLKPVPIVDTIREEEKYGNTGDKFETVGRGIVLGVEALGNIINKAISLPMEAVKKLSKSTTEALNNLGGKLVGLQ